MKKVFIVHGWTYSLGLWTELNQALQNRGIEPIQLQVPGLTAASNTSWDIEGYIDWLQAALKSETKPVVIGHSNGGRIALAFDQKHPGVIDQLILIDSAGIANQSTRRQAKLRTLKVMTTVGKPLAKVKPLRRVFYKLIGARDYLEASPTMRRTMQNMLTADKHMDFSKNTAKVIMIWGRNDTITPLSDGQKLRALLHDPPLHIIDNARHAPFSTHPEAVADIIANAIQP